MEKLSQLHKYPDRGSQDQMQREAYIKNVYTTMTIALYNLGVEHEYLNEYGRSVEYFQKAMYLTREMLGNEP